MMHGQGMSSAYVCGFALGQWMDPLMSEGIPTQHGVIRPVLLLRKAKPAWQAGKLNGVGGKIELGESARGAMAREFFEETLIATDPLEWAEFHCERWRSGVTVHFMMHGRLFLSRMRDAVKECQELTEPLYLRWLNQAAQVVPSRTSPDLMYNLPYLMAMASTIMDLPEDDRPLLP